MKSEITFRRQVRQRGFELKRRLNRSHSILGYSVYDKQGYVVVGDISLQGHVTTLEDIQKLLDDPNSVLNKEL